MTIYRYQAEVDLGIAPGTYADVFDAEVVVGQITCTSNIGNNWICRSRATLQKRQVSTYATGANSFNWLGNSTIWLMALVEIEIETPGVVGAVTLNSYSVVVKKAAG